MTCIPWKPSHLFYQRFVCDVRSVRFCAADVSLGSIGSLGRVRPVALTHAWPTTPQNAPEGRTRGTWLPGEFLAPSSWRRRSSVRIWTRTPGRSAGGEVNRLSPVKALNPTEFNIIIHFICSFSFVTQPLAANFPTSNGVSFQEPPMQCRRPHL